ncbi:antitoxin [bacterium]|nr:MAG: antitoxin [bacterium]
MKATLEIPDDLMRQIKMRALVDGRKLKDSVADLLRAGLAASKESLPKAVVVKDPRTGLPVIQGRFTAPAGEALSPERIAEILIEQEAEWALDAGR